MPRGVYKRKKHYERPKLPEPTVKERKDAKINMLIQRIISSIQNELDLIRELLNG
jgi:hypothetical protein